jgi:hypothetical protein
MFRGLAIGSFWAADLVHPQRGSVGPSAVSTSLIYPFPERSLDRALGHSFNYPT